MRQERVRVLILELHGQTIGYLAGFEGGKNIITFAPEYIQTVSRPTLTLSQLYKPELLTRPWITQQRLHPVLSNLLPEGTLRTWTAQSLKVHEDNEFPLLAWLGNDLPGALIAHPADDQEIPSWALTPRSSVEPVVMPLATTGQRFSLAGVQMKFSGVPKDGRYHVSRQGELGNWIIKTPSTLHPGVPLNEFSAMQLARLVAIEIPEIALVPMQQLDGLPDIQLPNEHYAYAIKRFDRHHHGLRVHTEDFAQILMKYAHEKYLYGNYEMIGRILFQFSEDGLMAVQQLARRLLVNILLGNGDAHLKNWTVYYPDTVTPALSPAYDIVYTQAYIQGETEIALNLGGAKNWYSITMQHFRSWARKVGISWPAVEVHLQDVINRARDTWPDALHELPMLENQKNQLRAHWRRLPPDWRIETAQ